MHISRSKPAGIAISTLAVLAVTGPAHLVVAGAADAATAGAPTSTRLTGVVDVVAVDDHLPAVHLPAVHLPAVQDEHTDAMVTRTFVQAGGRLLAVPGVLATGLRSGQHVTVTVRRAALPRFGTTSTLGDEPVVTAVSRPTTFSAGTARTALSPAGTHSLTLLPVYWTAPDSQTLAGLTALANDTAAYWAEQSGGRITVVPTVKNWAKITDPGSCDTSALFDRALAANGLAAPTSLNQHVLVYFPNRPDCGGWAGLGSVVGSRIWVNGYPLTDVTAHELGHNFGLGHANTATCTSPANAAVRVPLSSTCTVAEYQDSADVMGYATGQRTGNLNSALADALGLVQTVTATTTSPATLTLAPVSQVGATRAVKVDVGTGFVYVDFRPAAGRDLRRPAWAGVQVHYLPNGSYPASQLLDLQPGLSSAFQATSLPTWSVWPVPGAGVSLKVTAIGATATVQVVPTAGDATPPSAPRVTSVTGGATGTTLAWTAATDAGSGVGAYTILVDGVVAQRVGPDTRQASLTIGSGARSVQVDAYDNAGNRASSTPVAIGTSTGTGTGSGTGTGAGSGTGTGTGTGAGSTDNGNGSSNGTGGSDTTPPSTPSTLAPARGAVVGNRTQVWTWSPASDAESGVTGYRLYGNRQLLGTVASSVTSVNLTMPEGTATLGVAAVNGAGVAGAIAESTVTVDSIAPTAPTGLAASTETGSLTWTAPRDTGTALAYLVSVDAGADTRTVSTTVPITLTGRHTWSVTAIDLAGNTSAAATLTTSDDTTPPTAPGVSVPRPPDGTAGIVASRTATVSWTAATDDESGIAGYRVLVGGRLVATRGANARSAQVTLPEGTSTVSVLAVNAAGISGPAGSTSVLVDLTAPTAPALTRAASVNSTSAPLALAWQPAADPQSGIVRYLVSVNGIVVAGVDGRTTAISLPAAALGSGRPLRIAVIAVNGAGTRTASATVLLSTAAQSLRRH